MKRVIGWKQLGVVFFSGRGTPLLGVEHHLKILKPYRLFQYMIGCPAGYPKPHVGGWISGPHGVETMQINDQPQLLWNHTYIEVGQRFPWFLVITIITSTLCSLGDTFLPSIITVPSIAGQGDNPTGRILKTEVFRGKLSRSFPKGLGTKKEQCPKPALCQHDNFTYSLLENEFSRGGWYS